MGRPEISKIYLQNSLPYTVFVFLINFLQQAKKDKTLIPGYKLLVEIHKISDEIIETVRETGKTKRATRALQESANSERAKKVGEKMTKLKADFAKLQKEVDSQK